MINAIKAIFTKIRPQLSKSFGSPSQLVASLEHWGFHPIYLDDTFNSNQYTILRKLGYGQYSPAWLARDSRYQRYRALKMLRTDCYGGPHDIFEKEALLRISEHPGPNGDHVCFVFDVLEHHLDFQSAKYEDGKLPVKAVKVIARQLLLGPRLSPQRGDLKPTNILLELENPNAAISQYLAEVPRRNSPRRRATVPLREVITTPLVSEMEKPHIRIIDLGGKYLSDLFQSPALRAPEVTIGASWDIGVVEFVQGIVLFSGEASEAGSWTAEDDHLARIFERLINGTTKPFLKPSAIPDAEVPIFIDFLRGMLETDPGIRKSASELQHVWLNL
ncbi:kinase-like domain-containing protein [Aspergillus leporis]|uniref:non-specific serine/threonine protein kinase n=1 Tax=Aspergillus leporis TaxID=41062 RepID=A0A5N5WT46_9EURO|nr:kinase-like domain-containing protein [Aspergillus leporis]